MTPKADRRPSGRDTSRLALFVIVSMVVAVAIRAWLLATRAIPFNSDEAILGLMARHILAGARPIFFYGQAYMGSMDAWLIAGSFRLLGDSVVSIRVVQVVLYLLFMLVVVNFAGRVYGAEIGRWTIALAAVPPALVMTYTSATLGGYNEVLLLGSITLLLGFDCLRPDGPARRYEWLLLGVAAGLAFWTHGVTLTFIAPVGLIHLLHFKRERLVGYAASLAGFVAGSLPWWIYNLSSGWEALQVLTAPTPFESVWWERLFGFGALGVPALLGLRFPWSPGFLLTPILFLGVSLYTGVCLVLLMSLRRTRSIRNPGTQLLVALVTLYILGFVATQYGVDSTGRYLLPLYVPVLIAGGFTLETAWKWRKPAGMALLAGILFLNGFGLWRAASSSSGLTTQFDEITRFGNEHDRPLIEFLQQEGIAAGYANYWVSYRIAFLTNEGIILAPLLPYKPDLRYSHEDLRIDRYQAVADASRQVAYVTSLHPELDARLQREFDELGVTFRERQIGPYHVFFDLSRPITPGSLDLGPPS